MEYFVQKTSIVRKIWGQSDTILFIFAGASAEFALNKAVDWLYFTGRLPSDPLGRLFSTVSYARKIVFSDYQSALRAIDAMAAIHSDVEKKRGARIPDWAYRDVLFMIIDYSIRSYELLEHKLDHDDKREVFDVFNRVGIRMGLAGLPDSFEQWLKMRDEHLRDDLQRSTYTDDLFRQYRKHLGAVRFLILIESQKLVVPKPVKSLMEFRNQSLLTPLLSLYKISRLVKLDWLLKEMILPSKYKTEIKSLDIATRRTNGCPFRQ